MSAWFNNLQKDLVSALDQAKQQVEKLKEEATPALGAAVNAVKEQANKLKDDAVNAAEAIKKVAVDANNEILQEQERVKWAADPHSGADHLVTILPWEPQEESKSILSQPLMEQILALSLDESNFQVLSVEEREQFYFKLENYVDVVMKLLQLDPNLAKMHGKLGSRLPEEELWRAYFYRCACLRAEVGMGGGHDYVIKGTPIPRPPKPQPPSSSSSSSDQAAAGGGGGDEASSPSKKKGGKEKQQQLSPKKSPTKGGKGGGKAASSTSASSSPSKKGGASTTLGKGEGKKKEKKEESQQPLTEAKATTAADADAAATEDTAAMVDKEKEEEEEDISIDDDDLDLDGIDISDDEGGALEGEALEELEAQIAAELDDL